MKEQPALAGFVLVGGSALALRIHHRLSEDLDFACLEVHLPRTRVDMLVRMGAAAGFEFRRNDDAAAADEFLQGGLDLHDFQQDFLVNSVVKVSFFVPGSELIKVLTAPPESRARIATLPELFKAKCLVSARRSKTRDWLDLYLLMQQHGFSIQDYRGAFREAGNDSECDIGLSRLCSGTPQKNDEGYAHLLENAPTVEQMANFFKAQRNKLEVALAAERRRQSEK